jgi:hypothetical protein
MGRIRKKNHRTGSVDAQKTRDNLIKNSYKMPTANITGKGGRLDTLPSTSEIRKGKEALTLSAQRK